MVTTSLRPKARKKTFSDQVRDIKADVKTDFGYFSAAIKGEKYNDPNPERTASRAARSRAAMEDLQKSDNGSKSKAAPAAAAPDPKAVAAARMKAEGQKNRKKFEAEKGKKVKKRRKLLLNIKEASS